MKKQIQTNLSVGRKLSLNKKTISNLTAAEMSRQMGGTWVTDGCTRGCSFGCTYTCKGKTCNRPCTF